MILLNRIDIHLHILSFSVDHANRIFEVEFVDNNLLEIVDLLPHLFLYLNPVPLCHDKHITGLVAIILFDPGNLFL